MHGIFPRENIELSGQYLSKTLYNKFSCTQGLHSYTIPSSMSLSCSDLSLLCYLANSCATLRTDPVYSLTHPHTSIAYALREEVNRYLKCKNI